jgi:hypothetical protein
LFSNSHRDGREFLDMIPLMPFRQPLAVIILCVAACSTTDGSRKTAINIPGVERRDVEIRHESCDLTSSQAVAFDANADGKPEIIRVMDGPRELCRAIDINMDGTIDVFAYYDASGQQRRRESGFDRDALPDEISYYENGQLVRKERETNNDRKIDTWDYYQGGRLAREERDSAGDGYVNQWWAFNRPDRPECAVVMTDGDNDGKPDTNSQVDLCAEDGGGAPKTPAKAKATATADASAAPAPTAPAASAPPASPAASPASAAPPSPASPAKPASPKGTP